MNAEIIEKRLRELHGEYETGTRQLQALDRQREELNKTLLRISGAIQVLEELRGEHTEEMPEPLPMAGAAQ